MPCPTKYLAHWCCVFVLFLTAFFAFFFKKNYPEILRSRYIPTLMTVQSIEVVPRYCCDPDCACDEIDGLVLQSCSTMAAYAELLSPTLCAATGNSSQCPPEGAAAGCNNGRNYYNCGSYGCQYSSCSGTHIEQQLCQLLCDVCYNVPYTLGFMDRHKKSWNVTFSPGFGFSIDDANAYKAAHPVNSSIMAYYKPSNPGIVLFNIDFHARKWGLLVLFGFPLFVATVVLTQYMFTECLRMCLPALMKLDFQLNTALWIGIIWPFIILLPILKVGYVKPSGEKALNVLIPTIAAFGWLPLVLYRLEQLGWSKKASWILAFALLILPLGVLLPCTLVLVHSTTTSMCMGVVVGALLLLLASFLIASRKQLLAIRIYL
ncbi:hypothetical protein GOP47_0011957 [Adiantum capillus-veneris]|uniref:Uncharacterized protein n=1 Tax=Adiantum capillus-veneris TaxID=13818 RepID=A0A9D4ZFW3_ADICA|nr:hypothetical protein GOP47_0011957 [Adiantum capillus-veneris]